MRQSALIASIALMALWASARPALALGGDYEISEDGDVRFQQPDFPAALSALINSGPVFSGKWVNADSEFFFLGDTASLNRFLSRYATLQLLAPGTVTIHEGPDRVKALGTEEPMEQYDWSMSVRKVPMAHPEPKWIVQIDIWVDRNIHLRDLKLPTNLDARSGGEVDAFVLHALGKDLGSAAWNTYASYQKAVKAGEERTVGPEPEIPAKYWSDPIKALNPVRVYLFGLNVVVVQRIKDGTEEGKYITTLISSSIGVTGVGGFVITEELADRTARNFRRTRAPVGRDEPAP